MSLQFSNGDRVKYAQSEMFDNLDLVGQIGIISEFCDGPNNYVCVDFDTGIRRCVQLMCLEYYKNGET